MTGKSSLMNQTFKPRKVVLKEANRLGILVQARDRMNSDSGTAECVIATSAAADGDGPKPQNVCEDWRRMPLKGTLESPGEDKSWLFALANSSSLSTPSAWSLASRSSSWATFMRRRSKTSNETEIIHGRVSWQTR